MAENSAGQKKRRKKIQEVIPVNTKAKDTFFKKVYGTEERQRGLASFLLGIPGEKVATANVRPILFGNKENDFACLCDDIFYLLAEAQSSASPNIAYRLLEYVTAGLRSLVDSEQLLYSRKRVYFPIPKLYMLQVGLEETAGSLPEEVRYDMRLSESYIPAAGKYGDRTPEPDLEATVHVYDFRMALDEVLGYIETGSLPERFAAYDNDVRNYALAANGITYMQRTRNIPGYTVPQNIKTVAEYLGLMLDRGIFVDLFSDKEVCDMTMAQFSRDDILIYQGREEGRIEGREEGRVEGREEGEALHLIKTIYKKMLKGKTNEEIAEETEEEVILIEQVKKAVIAYKKDHDREEFDGNKVLEYYKRQTEEDNAKG